MVVALWYPKISSYRELA